MNPFVTSFLIITSTIITFMTVLSGILFHQERTKFARHMTELWMTYLLYFVTSLLTQGKAPEIVALSTIVWIWRLAAYRQILEDLVGVPLKKKWQTWILALGYGLGALGFFLNLGFTVATLPICLSMGLVGSWQVVSTFFLLRTRKLNIVYYMLLGNVFIVYLHILNYSLFRMNPDFVALGFGLVFLTTFLTAVLLPSVMFMEQTREQSTKLKALVEERTQQLINQSKFSALGEMAAGIAHEINNPLAVISGKASQLQRHLPEDFGEREFLRTGLENIENTAFRISRIIKGLKEFSRNADKAPMQPFALAEMVQDTLNLCQERFSQNGVELIIGQIPKIELLGRTTQISQVLLNILNNAFDAIDGSPERWIRIEFSAEARRLLIRIADSGPGIRPELRQKIMLPFFTTKEIGKGTGIGLSISKGIIEEHEGQLYLDPLTARTTFVIELPRSV